VWSVYWQAEKQLELQLFRLYHNEREIDEMNGELAHKNQSLDKENKRLAKIEDELKERKKEHGKLMKDIAKLEQQLKDSVWWSNVYALAFSLEITISELTSRKQAMNKYPAVRVQINRYNNVIIRSYVLRRF